MSESTQPAPRPIQKNKYGWIYFFVFVFVASIGVAVSMIAYNLKIQLTPERIEAAHKLWREEGPKDYRMVYRKQILGSSEETFVSVVRGGNVVEALMNGKPLEKEQRIYYSMEQRFSDIERFMTMDKKPGQPKVYVTGVFDAHTGAVRHYIRSVMGKKERIEMNINIEPLGEQQGKR